MSPSRADVFSYLKNEADVKVIAPDWRSDESYYIEGTEIFDIPVGKTQSPEDFLRVLAVFRRVGSPARPVPAEENREGSLGHLFSPG